MRLILKRMDTIMIYSIWLEVDDVNVEWEL